MPVVDTAIVQISVTDVFVRVMKDLRAAIAPNERVRWAKRGQIKRSVLIKHINARNAQPVARAIETLDSVCVIRALQARDVIVCLVLWIVPDMANVVRCRITRR